MTTVTVDLSRSSGTPAPSGHVWTVRTGRPGDADVLYGLIRDNLLDGRLLPRQRDELRAHVNRFVVAQVNGTIVAGAELAPLSPHVAEVRSLVVATPHRGLGIGGALVGEVRDRAARAGYLTLCAFAHDPALFGRLGFAIVPHGWLPEKIAKDCRGCNAFGHCRQYAMWLPLRSEAGALLAGRGGAADGAWLTSHRLEAP